MGFLLFDRFKAILAALRFTTDRQVSLLIDYVGEPLPNQGVIIHDKYPLPIVL